ncbi:ATP-binding protein [Salinisphaera hydrothermalis]|uniref:histidine kinase n=1 Tax=Salinisphaera hydrothermalis (strain C41B8) TaxID=1304275 RepID=A0A084IIV3_SALHC|nr:ATP-binding protein [Salinisphaera hydrothermalis]KEZ76637.1 periplasmic sensor signal transduction histidine kinase [Salinisphaera hydrothermalis C41B8]
MTRMLPAHVFSLEPAAVMRVLAGLRYLAVALMGIAVVLMAVAGRDLPPVLWSLPAILLAFNLGVAWRLRRLAQPSALELVGHLAVDTLALFVLFWTVGGATNPFVSLFLVPVALAATALSIRHAIAVTLLAVAAYTALLLRYLWRIQDPEAFVGFERHVVGMWGNFLLAAALLCGFLLVLAAVLRARERELAAQRERLMRDDAVVSVATVAAGAAHALNTPLSTIAVAAESLAEHPDLPADMREEVATIRSQAELCATELRRLVAARDPKAQEVTSLQRYIARLVSDWRARRPEIDLIEHGRETLDKRALRNDPALTQALANLLDNAADAAIAAGDQRLWLTWARESAVLEVGIDDPGRGLARGAGNGSAKSGGLGLGLTLARASLSRLGGDLVFTASARGGTRTLVHLPLDALEAEAA